MAMQPPPEELAVIVCDGEETWTSVARARELQEEGLLFECDECPIAAAIDGPLFHIDPSYTWEDIETAGY